MDTEDKEFKLEQPVSKSFIKRMFTPVAIDNELKYKGMNMWNPEVEWTLTTNEQFFGKQIRSAYYCKGGTGERKAIWSVPVKVGGYYKVFAYMPKIRFGFNRDGNQPEEIYNFNVTHDDGVDHPAVKADPRESTWVEVGTYHFSSDTARIELTNNSKAKSIYADAVKLVKEN